MHIWLNGRLGIELIEVLMMLEGVNVPRQPAKSMLNLIPAFSQTDARDLTEETSSIEQVMLQS